MVGVNGSGMHTNVSVTKNGKNLFWDPKGEEKMSGFAWQFVDRILTHGNDICLMLNPSVNAYRRLDPHFEAPNQIKASADGSRVDGPHPDRQRAQFPRGSPLGGARRQSLHGAALCLPHRPRRKHLRRSSQSARADRYLPDNIYDALDNFNQRGVDYHAARRRRQGSGTRI